MTITNTIPGVVSGPIGQGIRAWAVGHATERWGADMKAQAVELLTEALGGLDSAKVPEGSVTVIPEVSEVEVDLRKLRRAIGARAFSKVTRTELDHKALERAITTGEVDADAVASCVTGERVIRRRYLRITPAKQVAMDAARRAERKWEDLVSAAQAVCVAVEGDDRLSPDVERLQEDGTWDTLTPLERAVCVLLAVTPWQW